MLFAYLQCDRIFVCICLNNIESYCYFIKFSDDLCTSTVDIIQNSIDCNLKVVEGIMTSGENGDTNVIAGGININLNCLWDN